MGGRKLLSSLFCLSSLTQCEAFESERWSDVERAECAFHYRRFATKAASIRLCLSLMEPR